MSGNTFIKTKISPAQRLSPEFYLRTDVVQIARDLLGKILVTEMDGQRTAGIITETEAYRAPDDRACHAWNNRRTARTEVMFQEGGRAYVYLCYGIHHLFNVVTGPENMAHAVLVRAIEPVDGLELMLERRDIRLSKSGNLPPARLTTGPGALSKALGIRTTLSGQRLISPDTPVWIEDNQSDIQETDIGSGKRIGVDYAGECAEWPWRFWLKHSRYVKRQ
jgi:DNA-3-methyladenine glycosylase